MSQELDHYYENPALWKPERYSGPDAERVQLALSWLPSAITSILDAGCGNGILVNQLSHAKTAGIDRSFTALTWVKKPHAQADVSQLPFADASFDAVVCMEVIEHLPFDTFKRSLADLVRVTRRYLLITVPYQENLVVSQATCPQCHCRFHPHNHMRRFERAQMENLFLEHPAMRLNRLSGIVPLNQYRFLPLLRFIRDRRRSRSYFPTTAICPHCHYKESSPATLTEPVPKPQKVWQKLWPKESSFIWWMALYEKVTHES